MLNSKKYQIFASISFRSGKPAVFAAAFFLLALLLTPAQAKSDVVTDWNQIAGTAIVTNANRPPAVALVDFAYVHAAIYDAVNAIDGRYTPYAVTLANAPRTASQEAAAATAAYHVLKTLFPNQSAALETKYLQYLQTIPEGEPKTKGAEIGKEVAVRFMALRANDGRDAAVPFTQGTGPGAWQPTPPAYAPPLAPWMAVMRPFVLESPSQFRAEGPPSMTSEQWTRDYNETKNYGALNSTVRTPQQTEIGRFYAEHTGTQYSRIIRTFAMGQNLSVADNSRLFAMLYLAIADSLIAGMDSKYYFAYWRPVTAIRAGETDGNNSRISGGARLRNCRVCRNSARFLRNEKSNRHLVEHGDEYDAHFP
jgi:hypothetical protein